MLCAIFFSSFSFLLPPSKKNTNASSQHFEVGLRPTQSLTPASPPQDCKCAAHTESLLMLLPVQVASTPLYSSTIVLESIISCHRRTHQDQSFAGLCHRKCHFSCSLFLIFICPSLSMSGVRNEMRPLNRRERGKGEKTLLT